jgi:hypothetical protein
MKVSLFLIFFGVHHFLTGVSPKYYAATELPLLALQEPTLAREDLMTKKSKHKMRKIDSVRVPGMISSSSSSLLHPKTTQK